MTQPFLGQIQPYGFGFAPTGWAQCNGQILSISQNTALFSLLGTFYGGNGQTTFALPNLQSRVPMHQGTFVGNSYSIGEEAGEESITLNISEMPMHNHAFVGTTANANNKQPKAGVALAQTTKAGPVSPADPAYAVDTTPQPMNPAIMSFYGNNQAHTNLQPYLTINWCIALRGIFPSRN